MYDKCVWLQVTTNFLHKKNDKNIIHKFLTFFPVYFWQIKSLKFMQIIATYEIYSVGKLVKGDIGMIN